MQVGLRLPDEESKSHTDPSLARKHAPYISHILLRFRQASCTFLEEIATSVQPAGRKKDCIGDPMSHLISRSSIPSLFRQHQPSRQRLIVGGSGCQQAWADDAAWHVAVAMCDKILYACWNIRLPYSTLTDTSSDVCFAYPAVSDSFPPQGRQRCHGRLFLCSTSGLVFLLDLEGGRTDLCRNTDSPYSPLPEHPQIHHQKARK